jgi:hypothetical protein
MSLLKTQLLFILVLIAFNTNAKNVLKLAAISELDQETGTTSVPCGNDGKCNIAACKKDPDCPVGMPSDNSNEYPTETVATSCGGTLEVNGSDTPLGKAAVDVANRYSDFNKAQKAKNPSYFDSHPSGVFATGHAELSGYGVTMIQGKWPKPLENASGNLSDPSLLFFEKNDGKQNTWQIIGMGYTFKIASDNMAKPSKIDDIPVAQWLIHEAGYHHSPGDGGFTCADNDDLKNSAYKAGKRVDTAGCFGIEKDDLKTKEFKADSKHGRFWTVHIWFEPKTLRPTISKTDPWCRQSKSALRVPSCAFYQRTGTCD